MQSRLLGKRIQGSKKSVLLLGPRQVGKSTLCRGLRPDLIVNLAREDAYLTYSKDPSRLRREVESEKPRLVLVDEVQRVPRLLNEVQAILDEHDKPPRFLLTGSSARKLRKAEVNLLPGRVIRESLGPLTVRELSKRQFDLERALQVGMLPGIYLDRHEGEGVLATYAETYLREEIRFEAAVKEMGDYARFLDAAAIESGRWINYSKLASDLEIPKETIRRYFQLLEDTLLCIRLPSLAERLNVSRKVAQRSKFYLFDVGVRNALLGQHDHKLSSNQRGPAFEHWLVSQIHALNSACHAGYELCSYRTDQGAEVDLVLLRRNEVIGIEVKASKNVGPSDLRGLRSLRDSLPKSTQFTGLIAYLGERAQAVSHDIRAVPYLSLLGDSSLF